MSFILPLENLVWFSSAYIHFSITDLYRKVSTAITSIIINIVNNIIIRFYHHIINTSISSVLYDIC